MAVRNLGELGPEGHLAILLRRDKTQLAQLLNKEIQELAVRDFISRHGSRGDNNCATELASVLFGYDEALEFTDRPVSNQVQWSVAAITSASMDKIRVVVSEGSRSFFYQNITPGSSIDTDELISSWLRVIHGN